MIDKAAIEAGVLEMKRLLIKERNEGAVNFLGAYDPGKQDPVSAMVDWTEIEGNINVAHLAQAFMAGAGIEPVSEIVALQAEVATLRAEVEELRAAVATMRLVPRPGSLAEAVEARQAELRRQRGFTPLAPKPHGNPQRED